MIAALLKKRIQAMKELLLKLQTEGYPLTTVARHTGVPHWTLRRCSKGELELKEGAIKAVQEYAERLGIK